MSSNVASETGQKAGRREWVGLAVLALPTMLIGLDITVLHLAVPQLSVDLQPSSSQLLWIVDIYGFLIAGFLLTMGTLGDRIGRRRLLLVGAATFALASGFAAFSSTPEMLIAARALLGIAGATLMPSTLSLIRNMFLDAQQRTVAISAWMTSLMAGTAIGPLVGGALLAHFWWGSVFLLSIPVMLLLLAVAPVLLPEYRNPGSGRIDPSSVVLSLAAILPVVYGLKESAAHGLGWLPALSLMAGLTIGAVFIRRQRTLADPTLDLQLFGDRAFSASVTTHLLSLFLVAGIQYLIAQHLQLVLGLPPLQAGLWTLPAAIGGLVGAMLAPVLVRTTSPSGVITAGLVTGSVGFGILTQIDAHAGLPVLVVGFIITSFAIGLVTALTTDLIIGSAPPERAGAASGISETSAELGIALGIAVLGSIGTAVYRNQVAGAVLVGVPPDAAQATRDTLGGAVAAANQLPGERGIELLHTAREAFTQGLQLNAGLSALVVIGLAIMSATLLRHASTSSGPDGLPDQQRGGSPHDLGTHDAAGRRLANNEYGTN
ncbi:MAG TPA: MFS transporter [Pseudonocardiaceae bacterium]|jgi:DHA2 family multidrug resistance protein-like MFS transporter|nr:MFS transporter [Pseudonocardiaceae bacterium]